MKTIFWMYSRAQETTDFERLGGNTQVVIELAGGHTGSGSIKTFSGV